MEHKFMETVLTTAKETQITVAVLLGMLLQFFSAKKRNARVAFLIIGSSLFVALYGIPPVVEYMELEADSPWVKTLYAFSSLISLEIISIALVVLPNTVRERFLKFMEVEDATTK